MEFSKKNQIHARNIEKVDNIIENHYKSRENRLKKLKKVIDGITIMELKHNIDDIEYEYYFKVTKRKKYIFDDASSDSDDDDVEEDRHGRLFLNKVNGKLFDLTIEKSGYDDVLKKILKCEYESGVTPFTTTKKPIIVNKIETLQMEINCLKKERKNLMISIIKHELKNKN